MQNFDISTFNWFCLNKKSFLVFVIYSFFFLSEVIFSVSFAQTVNLNPTDEKKVSIKPEKRKYAKWPEARYKTIYVMENMAPLPFKKSPYKPIYKGEISKEIVDESQNIKELAIKQEVSTFDIQEKKKKERKKNLQLMLSKEKNKKFFEYLKSVKRTQSKPPTLKGFGYDYTDYLKNFLMISKR